MHERNVERAAKHRHDFVGFGLAHQAMIDEHAGELIADRFVDQHGGHGGIDAARQPADDAAFAHLGTNFRRSSAAR